KPLWAQTFEVAADNAFTLEDSIAERVVSNLSGSLTGQQQRALNKRPTANASAYANYLRGRYFAANYYTEDGYRKALHYLQNAIDDDPAYALAYSGLADTYYDTSNLVFLRTKPCRERKPLRIEPLNSTRLWPLLTFPSD
ncbi:MAG: hypothetical protein DMG50_01860, partial [Acidobacteria bacterium]